MGFNQSKILINDLLKLYLNDITSEIEDNSNEIIGSGSESIIIKGRYKNEVVALRILFDNNKCSNSTSAEDNEISLLTKLDNIRILKIYGIKNICFRGIDTIAIVMEHCEYRSLDKVFVMINNDDIKLELIKQILDGLIYLHSKNIVHRDLKPENILVRNISSNSINICIGDFGNARIFNDRMKTLVGTLEYVAPEIKDGLNYDYRIDVYSVGIIIKEIIIGVRPDKFTKNILLPGNEKLNILLSYSGLMMSKIPTIRPSIIEVRKNI